MSIETERTIIINKTMPEVWDVLKEFTYRKQDPVMLAGPFNEGGVITGVFKQMRIHENGGRSADDTCTGTLTAIPGKGSVRIVFRLGELPDPDLFWLVVDNLQTRLGVSVAEADDLDALDRKIIAVVARFEREGITPTDELVATRLPPNPKTDKSYHRVSINRRRCKLRDRGYKV